MKNQSDIKKKLLEEISLLKQRVHDLEKLDVERRREEEILSKSELLMRAITDSAQDAILMCDAEGRISFWNPAARSTFGYTKEEAIGRDIHHFLAPERFWETYKKAFGKFKKTGQGQAMKKTSELQARRKNGEEFPIELSLSGIRLEDGWHAVGIVRDISLRKQAETALRESETLYRTFINASSDLIFLKDELFRNIVINDAFAAFLGKPAREVIGKDDFELMPPEAAGNCRLSDVKALESNSIFASEEIVGDQVYETLKFPVDLGSGKVGVGGFIRNVTERRRLEERLQRAEKMESLGILAGGVAHDLNNILGVMMGYSELIMLSLKKESPLYGHVKNIMKSTERATAVVQDMLTLGRRGIVTKHVVNLNSIIEDQLRTPEYLELASQDKVRVETHLEKDLLNIEGSPAHIAKALMNLIFNAAESIKGKGSIVIRTQNRYLDRPVSGYDQVNVGDYAVLTVTDSGEGISPKEMKRIFEPFYTKKVMSRSGTGLGLSVVWGTVKDHDAYIDVKSEKGKGSVFALYFPVTRKDAAKEQKKKKSEYMGSGEAILVVDDVQDQRELAAKMLKRLNYSASMVSSGEEALEFLGNHDVDLVLLDMIMDPGIDGLDTYRKIVKIKPGQKAIIVSGYAETDRVKEVQRLGAGSFVRKPYILEKIGMAIKRELNA